MVRYLQPKPTEEEAAKVKCPVCKNTANLSKVGSHNGNKGRWYYGCCKFIKFADGMLSRKEKAPLQEPPSNHHVGQPAGQPAPSASMYEPIAMPQTMGLSQTPAILSQAVAGNNPCVVQGGLSQSSHFNSDLQGSQQLSQMSESATLYQDRLHGRQAQTSQLRMSHNTHTTPVVAAPPVSSAGVDLNQVGSQAPCWGPFTRDHTTLGTQHLVSPNTAPSAMNASFTTPQCMSPAIAAAPDVEHTVINSVYGVNQNVPSTIQPDVLPSQTHWQQAGLSQMSQDSSSQAWAASQNASMPVWQHAAIGAPVGLQSPTPTPTQAPILVSPPKSPPGSLAARAAALSQVIQGSPQGALDLNGPQNTALRTPVRPRSPSEDLDALFAVLESPAVKQKVARVQAEKLAREGNTTQTPEDNDKSNSSDDEALFDVLDSPEVVRRIQQSAMRSKATEGLPDAAEGSPKAMSIGVTPLAHGFQGMFTQAQSPAVQGGIEGRPEGEHGVGALNSPVAGAPQPLGGMHHQRLQPSETQHLYQREAAPEVGPSGQGMTEPTESANPSLHDTALATSAPQKRDASNDRPDEAAEHGDWMDVGVAAESDEDDVVVVHTQPLLTQTQPVLGAASQVIDLC